MELSSLFTLQKDDKACYKNGHERDALSLHRMETQREDALLKTSRRLLTRNQMG